MAGNSITTKEAYNILKAEGFTLKRMAKNNHAIFVYDNRNLVIRSQRFMNKSTLLKKIKAVKGNEKLY